MFRTRALIRPWGRMEGTPPRPSERSRTGERGLRGKGVNQIKGTEGPVLKAGLNEGKAGRGGIGAIPADAVRRCLKLGRKEPEKQRDEGRGKSASANRYGRIDKKAMRVPPLNRDRAAAALLGI